MQGRSRQHQDGELDVRVRTIDIDIVIRLLVPGCHAGITAEKLEASFTVSKPVPKPVPNIEVHYDKDSSRSGDAEESSISD